MGRSEELKALETEMAKTALPLKTNLIFGEGDPNAEIVFIGEAPGETEDRLKRPFVGRGGQLLRECIRDIGWKEEDVYITNIVKRRPPNNRDPEAEEIAAYAPFLKRQIEILDPPIIVALGRFSMNYFLPHAKITKDQGKIFLFRGRCIVPMLHPAAALRSPEAMSVFKNTFEKLPRIVEKCKKVLAEFKTNPERPKDTLF